MSIILPGNDVVAVDVASYTLLNTDDSLIDIDSNLIIDTAGNTISIGGGHDSGDDVTSATLTPGDEPTTTYTGADDPTAVTWG